MAQLPEEQVSNSFEVDIDSDTTGRNAGNADNVDVHVNNVEEEEELGEGETTEEGSSNQQDRREHYREAMFGDGRGRGAGGRGGRYGFFDRGGLGSFGGRGGGMGSFGGRRGGGCGGFIGEFPEVQADEFEDPRMEFDRVGRGGGGPFCSQGFDDDFYEDPRIGFGGIRGRGGHGCERGGGVFHAFNRQFDYFARPCMAHTHTTAGVNENASKNNDDTEKTQKPADSEENIDATTNHYTEEDDAPPCTCDVRGSNMYTAGPRQGWGGFMRGRGGFGNPRMQFVLRGGWRGAGTPYARPHRFPGHHNDLPSMTIGVSIPLTRPPFQSHSFGGCRGPRPPFRPEHGLVW